MEKEKEQKRLVEEEKRRKEYQRRNIPSEIGKCIEIKESNKAKIKAGEEGEIVLRDKAMSSFSDHCHWWANKRAKKLIGDKSDSGPNEIDFIIVSHNNIHLFEAKHFSGYLMRNPIYPVQDKVHPFITVKRQFKDNKPVDNNSNIKLMENLVEKLEIKKNKLAHLLQEKGINIDSNKIKYYVVFTKRNFHIDDSVFNTGLFSRETLFSVNDLKKYLEKDEPNLDYEKLSLEAQLVKYIINNEKNNVALETLDTVRSEQQYLTSNILLIDTINSLPSWDCVVCYNGDEIRGDLLKVKDIFNFENATDLGFLNKPCDIIVHTKRDPKQIRNDWDSGINQKLEIQNEKGETIAEASLNYEKSDILFHIVGEDNPETISIYNIRKIQLRGLYKVGNETKSI
jgi:hypothetical protein